MILPFIGFEALIAYLFLSVIHARLKRIAESLAGALLLDLSASVFVLIPVGLVFGIRPWVYMAVKSFVVLCMFFGVRPKRDFSFLEANRDLIFSLQMNLRRPPVLLMVFLLLAFFFMAADSYPVLWDSYSYHLPMAASFLQDGLLTHYQYYGIPIGAYYPHSIELLYSLFFSINGIERSSLVNFPSIILLALGLYLLSREVLKMQRTPAILGSILFLFFPVVSDYFFDANVDLYFLSFALLATYAILRFSREKQSDYLAGIILLSGLLMGTRYQGLSLAALLGASLVWIITRNKAWRSSLRTALIFVPIAAVTGGFFYLRNIIIAGNPFFPLKFGLPGIFRLAGHYDYSVLAVNTAVLFNLSRYGKEGLYVLMREMSFGLAFFAVCAVVALVKHKNLRIYTTTHFLYRILLVLAFFCFINFLVTPYSAVDSGGGFNVSLRLGLVFLGLFYLSSLGAAHAGLSRSAGYLFLPFVLLLTVSSGFSGMQHIIPASGCLISVFLSTSKRLKILIPGIPAAVIVILLLFQPSPKKWESELDELSVPPSAKIAYAGANRHFQLYDEHLNRRLLHINVDRDQGLGWNMDSEVTYHRREGEYSLWLTNLIGEDVDYIVLYSRLTDYVENRWVNQNSALFPREKRNIYRVDKEKIRDYLSTLDRSPCRPPLSRKKGIEVDD